MRCNRIFRIFAVFLLGTLTATFHLSAQTPAEQNLRYKVVDMGTLGGPEATLSFAAKILNNRGMFGGQMDAALALRNFRKTHRAEFRH